MSLNFGEIVEPTSRAFWDNYEDLEENDTYDDPCLRWLTDSEEPTFPENKHHVVVVEGENVTEFVNGAILKNQSPLCQTDCGRCAVFDLPDSPVLLVISEEKNLHLFSLITELLKPFLEKATTVSTLSILPSATHKQLIADEEDDPICYLRKMNSDLDDVKELEEPNFISGVAAGVSVWRKFEKQTFSNYIAYMEAVSGFDSVSTQPIIELLHRLNVPCASSYTGSMRMNSNLYM